MTSSWPAALRLLARGVRRWVLLRRRLLAALAAAGAVLLGLQAVRPPAAPTVAVWAAVRDLPAGARLGVGDLRRAVFPRGTFAVRAAPMADLVGRTVIAPVARGQPLTALDVVGARSGAGYPGRVVVPVRLGDPDVAALLRPGDRVDVVAGDPRGGSVGTALADDAVVVTVPAVGPDPPTSTTSSGRLVLFAVAADDATGLAAAGLGGFLSVVWTH